jgi:hypothetical protein
MNENPVSNGDTPISNVTKHQRLFASYLFIGLFSRPSGTPDVRRNSPEAF